MNYLSRHLNSEYFGTFSGCIICSCSNIRSGFASWLTSYCGLRFQVWSSVCFLVDTDYHNVTCWEKFQVLSNGSGNFVRNSEAHLSVFCQRDRKIQELLMYTIMLTKYGLSLFNSSVRLCDAQLCCLYYKSSQRTLGKQKWCTQCTPHSSIASLLVIKDRRVTHFTQKCLVEPDA